MRPERDLEVSNALYLRPGNAQGSLRLIIPASEWSVRCGLQNIKVGIERLSLSADEMSTIELVIAEVLNNVVEHAYKDIEHGMIEVELYFGDTGITCIITDDGIPMPGGKLPQGEPKDLTGSLEDLPEGGFGWLLIRELTQDLHYGRVDNRNVVSCRLNVGINEAAPR